MKLPSLIADFTITLDKLPKGKRQMQLDKKRAKAVSDTQNLIATLQHKLQLIATVDNAALNAVAIPELELELENAKARLLELLNSYGSHEA